MRSPRSATTVAAAIATVAALAFSPVVPQAAPPDDDVARDSSDAASTEEIYNWVEEIVEIGFRRTGTPSGRQAANYMAREFRQLGLQDVRIETASSWNWEADRWGLEVEGDDYDSFYTSHSFVTPGEPSTFSTGPDGRTAEIVDVGLGTPAELAAADVEGKIVLFDLKFLLPTAGLAPFFEFVWDPDVTLASPPETMLRANPYITTLETVVETAQDSGAVGFVGVLADYFDSNRYHNEFYRKTPFEIPGLWVTPDEGAEVRRAIAAADGPAEATMRLEGSRVEADGRSVLGVLPGKSDETIMIQSHHDSVTDGAVEDASGSAEVLALAEYFARVPAEEREKTLLFTTFDTHFTGYQAHQKFVEDYITNPDSPYDIVANVTLEHIGKQALPDEDGQLEVNPLPEPRGIFENVGPQLKATLAEQIVKHDLDRMAMLNGEVLEHTLGGLPTDASFVFGAGVPTVSLISGPLYLYDEADTLDKVDVDDLRPVARAFIELVEAIDDTPADQIGFGPDALLGGQAGSSSGQEGLLGDIELPFSAP